MKCKNPKCYRELTSADLAFSKSDGYCVQCWAAGVPELVAEVTVLQSHATAAGAMFITAAEFAALRDVLPGNPESPSQVLHLAPRYIASLEAELAVANSWRKAHSDDAEAKGRQTVEQFDRIKELEAAIREHRDYLHGIRQRMLLTMTNPDLDKINRLLGEPKKEPLPDADDVNRLRNLEGGSRREQT